MPDLRARLARVRRRRRKLEAMLPDGTFEVADLDEDQREAFHELGRVFKREHELIGAEWLARGGRVLTVPGRGVRFREPRPSGLTQMPARALSAAPRGASRTRARRTRTASRSSTRSDDDGGGEAPPAARAAVAEAWERILRRRHPGVAWEVEGWTERSTGSRE